MVAFVKVNQFVEDLAKKVHNLSADTLKILLTNTDPTASAAVKSDLTEITAQNGYGAGGAAVTITSCEQTSGTLALILVDLVITASGGSVGPFRYAVLYNDTPTSPADPIIGYYDYGSSITLNDTEPFTIDFNGAGAITLA